VTLNPTEPLSENPASGHIALKPTSNRQSALDREARSREVPQDLGHIIVTSIT
jgi:hypothetical protein